jgi:hypothetical protein
MSKIHIVKHRKTWTQQETHLYWIFVKENQEILEVKEKNKKQKIFN